MIMVGEWRACDTLQNKNVCPGCMRPTVRHLCTFDTHLNRTVTLARYTWPMCQNNIAHTACFHMSDWIFEGFNLIPTLSMECLTQLTRQALWTIIMCGGSSSAGDIGRSRDSLVRSRHTLAEITVWTDNDLYFT